MIKRNFEEAFRSRYADLLTNIDPNTAVKISCKEVELIGMDKVAKQIDSKLVTEIDLSLQCIEYCGEVSDEIKEKLIVVDTLNLRLNLLSRWSEVIEIVKLFPKLKTLELTGNRMYVPADWPTEMVWANKRAMAPVKNIILGSSGLTWHYVVSIDGYVHPGLETLSLFKNQITEITRIPHTSFKSLKKLDLSSNQIKSWSQVIKLSEINRYVRTLSCLIIYIHIFSSY